MSKINRSVLAPTTSFYATVKFLTPPQDSFKSVYTFLNPCFAIYLVILLGFILLDERAPQRDSFVQFECTSTSKSICCFLFHLSVGYTKHHRLSTKSHNSSFQKAYAFRGDCYIS